MKRKTLLLNLLLGLFVVSCESLMDYLPFEKRTMEEFENKTPIPVYFIVDLAPSDNRITSGSETKRCGAKSCCIMDFQYKRGLYEIVKDSAYIYVLDARLIKLPSYYESKYDSDVNGAMVARLTYVHRKKKIKIVFPQPEEGFSSVYYNNYKEELDLE